MTPFTTHTGIAAALPMPNLDTDVIIPKQFLKRIDREGLAEGVFFDLFKDQEFVLNRPPWDTASILICGENFGCGSSREYAVWGLMQWGIRAIIAPSFAGIFFGNCEKNGLLAVDMPADDVEELSWLAQDPATAQIGIDLHQQRIIQGGSNWQFDIPAARKALLLEGKDHIACTLEHETEIATFERHHGSDAVH
ncbi:3-isopropylmalate dehydratase small subunit [Litoreibacter roseus]|uniref:3-isopropylmalate dehydratase small subunit n=1 Tax=Litoreibacter roseus TaxID=2601869 RepID=A0A6N6JNT5_9RHOB|nr:3-isopropylmalate dehydratase small subunit [Litoreibacter roseus]GFE67052.1 3-isopropylmalate dehydratase small subunit [Litoreibacter roseus]